MKHWLLGVLIFFCTTLQAASLDKASIVCVHGFLGSPRNMRYLVKNFQAEGSNVINWKYPSRDKTIEGHAEDLVITLQEISSKNPGKPIHFIAHSMGSLVVRKALNHPSCPSEAKRGKAVLFGPPNQGISLARYLSPYTLMKKIAKSSAGKELMAEKDFEHLGSFPPSMPVLVIAGTCGYNPLITGENDGVVAVSETFLTTPHKHIKLYRGHKSLLFSKKALGLAKEFLEE